MIRVFAVIVLLLQPIAALAGEIFAFGSTPPKDPAVAQVLRDAQTDFDAVLKGYKPVHAIVDTEAPRPMDGGTITYKAAGYQLTVVQSLENVGGVNGYLYGPALVILPPYAGGNDSSISHVTFYSREALSTLLAKHKP